MGKIKDFILSIIQPRRFISFYLKLIIVVLLYIFRIQHLELFTQDFFIIKIVDVLIFYIMLNLIFNYGRLTIIYIYLRRNKLPKDHFDNFILGINRVSFALNHILFILMFFHKFVMNIKEFLTTISIIAVAIVLISKDYLSNFISGIVIMFSNELRLKDYVKIGDYKGIVNDITLKHVELKTEQSDFIYIPNTVVYNKEIVNYTKGSLKKIKVDLFLNNSYKKDYENIRTELIKKLSENFNEINNLFFKIEKIDKDYFHVIVEVNVTKYKYKLEVKITNFINEYIINSKYGKNK